MVSRSRDDLAPHNLPYAHDHAPLDFLQALEEWRPHVLIGATGRPGTGERGGGPRPPEGFRG